MPPGPLGLFLCVKSSPCRFGLFPNDRSDAELVTKIREGGGVVEDPRTPDTSGHRICFVDPRALVLPNRDDGDVFSINYIHDCVSANELKLNLMEYRVNTRSIYEKYEPLKIFLGMMTWSEIPRKFSCITRSPQKSSVVEEEVSDIDDDIVQMNPSSPRKKADDESLRKVSPKKLLPTSQAPSASRKVTEWMKKSERSRIAPKTSFRASKRDDSVSMLSVASTKNGRLPYTKKEQISIIQDIIKQKAFNKLKGNTYWMEAENQRQVCKGNRTWQSMKEHFRKKVTFTCSMRSLHSLHKCSDFRSHRYFTLATLTS